MNRLPSLLNRRVDPAAAIAVVDQRTLRARLTARWGGSRPTAEVESLYWPIAIIHARATSTGRRAWIEHTVAAIDLVSGRIGLVDEKVPLEREVEVRPESVIPPRLGRQNALAAWHDYHRDYVDRRRRPMRPPALEVERIEPTWLEHRLVTQGDQRFVVDPVTLRADPLEHFPWVARCLTTADSRPMTPKGQSTCPA
jgi:hypothetical protein